MTDLISRQDAIGIITKKLDMDYLDGYTAIEELKALPSAEQERKKGKWLNYGQYADFFPHSEYRCSVCDTPYLEIEMYYNFCPNCGADMRGRGDE